jgi:phosphohistidine swiveling domain-containing protein
MPTDPPAAPAPIIWPEDVAADPALLARLGGKAGAFARLAGALEDFPVPPWLVVVWEEGAGDGLDARLPPALEKLAQRAGAAPGRPWKFAVRSSALQEDSAHTSFAGLFETYLEVPPGEVAARVADVWASAGSERVATYWREQGLTGTPRPPAVLVQWMIQPAWAGVAFSADPVSGRRAVAVVSSVQGLGERLVSGEANAHTCRIAADGALLEETPGDDAPLPADRVREVAALARRCERHFGRPQDIEWGLEGDRLWLLQSRPITSLRGLPDPDAEFQIWDNSNIAESYPGVISALTFSFAVGVYEAVYREFCRILSVPKARLAANDGVFANMLGWHGGRIYYNLLNWYRVLALLPGFGLNRGLMEKMMGVGQELPRERVEAVLPPAPSGFWARQVEFYYLVRGIRALERELKRLPRTAARFQQRLDAAMDLPPLEGLRLDQLAAAYRRLESQLLLHWDAPLINDFFAMIFHGMLRKTCEKWLGDESAANSLLLDTGQIISAEPARRIREMARLAAPEPEMIAALKAADLRQVYHLAATDRQVPDDRGALGPGYCAQLANLLRFYLVKFGDRCAEELKLESPTLRDDPGPLLRSIAALAERGNAAQEPILPADHRPAKPPVPRGFYRPFVFKYLWKRARYTVIQRENLRFERTRVFGAVRRIFVEIGKRLAAEGRLDAPEDIFHLTVPEILGYIEGNGSLTDLAATATLRKAEYARHLAEPPPPNRFATYGPPALTGCYEEMRRKSDSAETAAPDDPNARQGLGGCPGVVRAKVQVIRDPRTAQFQQGHILVAERTDPGWVVLFPLASAIIVEHGSLLSHTAIVARELRIPTVLGVTGATTWLQDEDEVELDGAAGIVTRKGNVGVSSID